jgi:hypothetical protein
VVIDLQACCGHVGGFLTDRYLLETSGRNKGFVDRSEAVRKCWNVWILNLFLIATEQKKFEKCLEPFSSKACNLSILVFKNVQIKIYRSKMLHFQIISDHCCIFAHISSNKTSKIQHFIRYEYIINVNFTPHVAAIYICHLQPCLWLDFKRWPQYFYSPFKTYEALNKNNWKYSILILNNKYIYAKIEQIMISWTLQGKDTLPALKKTRMCTFIKKYT